MCAIETTETIIVVLPKYLLGHVKMAAKNKHIFSTPIAVIVFRRKMDKLSGKQIVRSGGGMAARRLLN